MAQLSVIIPIYNTPPGALERCFQSLDSLQVSYEAVLIDDGSEPSVGDFCKAYGSRDPRFRYFYQENRGVSAARNHGIQKARGEYLMFVDADDELLGQVITGALLQGQEELLLFDMLVWQGEQESCHHAFEQDELPVDRERLLHRLITSKALNSPCDKLFKRDILLERGLTFPEDFVTGEDWMFVAAFARGASRVRYVPRPCYRYFMEQSTGRSRVLRYPDKILDNQLTRYAARKEILAGECWQRYDPARMLSKASAELVENLFNTAAELLTGKAFAGQRRQKLIEAAGQAGENLLPGTAKKTKIKLLILTRLPVFLRPMAWLRKIYLNKR